MISFDALFGELMEHRIGIEGHALFMWVRTA